MCRIGRKNGRIRASRRPSTIPESASPAAAASSAAPPQQIPNWNRIKKGDELLHRSDDSKCIVDHFALEGESGDKFVSVAIKDENGNILFSPNDEDRRAACKKAWPGECFNRNDYYVRTTSTRRRLTSLERIIRGAQQFEELKRSQGLV